MTGKRETSPKRIGVVGKLFDGVHTLIQNVQGAFSEPGPRFVHCLPEDIPAVAPLLDAWLMLHYDSSDYIEILKEHRGPVVGRSLEYNDHGFPIVAMCDETVGRLAGEHLVERCAGDLVFLGVEATFSNRRWNGFRDYCLQAGREARRHLVWEIDMDDLARNLPDGSGVFGMNDAFARGVIESALKQGRTVPGEIATLGVDNAPMPAEGPQVALSTIELPLAQQGRKLGEMLSDLMAGRHVPLRRDAEEPRLIRRSSTELPSGRK